MNGTRRVVIFCVLTAILPSILIVLPLYLRNIKFADVLYRLSDSDVIQIHKGQSSIFCAKHSLTMNITFNAFQMRGRPELSNKRKHIRLKKSMTLPEKTLEYWGFYLFKGATVELKVCSQHKGAKILVVKGDKVLDTCGILNEDGYKKTPTFKENQHVLVKLETPKEESRNGSHNNNYNISQDKDIKFSFNFTDNLQNITNMVKYENMYLRNRNKRNLKGTIYNPNTVLDTGVNHGGNAFNKSEKSTDHSAMSSFEKSLHKCYHDNMLMNNNFPYSTQCNNTKYLEQTTTLRVTHEVLCDGYYYYIFYSNSHNVKNNIHAIFDIYKPTFQYVNMSESKVCINKTDCEFDVGFFSDELVIVEVPTIDGLKNHNESFVLVSACHPRMTVYIIFPISVLLLILLFAFL